MKRLFERTIEREIQLTYLLVDNRAYLPGPGVAVEVRPLISKLGRKAESHRQMIFLRNRYTRTDVRPYPFPAAVRLYAGELIKARLEPLVEAVRDLHGFVD